MKYIKWKKRLSLVLINSGRNIVPLVLNSLISFLVIKFSSFSVWGELVSYLIIFNLGAQFIIWGNKQYLLREFSLDNSKLAENWFENLKARLPLLLIVVLIILLLQIPSDIKFLLIFWQLIIFFNRSFEVLILYFKKMKFFLLLEIMLSLISISIIILSNKSITVQLLLFVFVIIELIRLIVFSIYFRKKLQFHFSISIDLKILLAGFIFFLLGTIGMLQSRLDLYFVALLLHNNELAVYQILINYILLIQAATGFIIQPYLKEIYRMNRRTLAKFSFRFTLFGFIISIPITFALALVLKRIYGINISWQMALLSFLYIIPIFYYTIRVYILYKIKKESLILFAGISVLIVSIPLNYFLISIYKINGALISGVMGELLSLLFYYFFEKRVGLINSTISIHNSTELS